MKLLFLSNVYPSPVWPGKGTFNRSLIRALSERDQVRVICPVAWTDRLRSRGVKLPTETVEIDARLSVDFPTYWFTPRILRSMYGEFMDWSIGERVERGIRELGAEAIVSYWAHPDGAVAVKHARKAGIPAITMVGGSDVLLLAKSGKRREKILDVLKQSDRVIAVSEDIAMKLERDGIDGEKVRVIRRGVQKELFSPGDQGEARHRLGLPLSRKIIIAVGRLVGVKGFDRLIETCRVLRDQGEDVLCFILGDGELRGALEGQIKRHGLGEKVFLPGGQQQSRLADWYRSADLTVLTSWSEGVPNVLLETIACGTPFAATDVGGVSEISDPVAHRLVRAGDVKGLASTVVEMLKCGKVRGPWRYEPTSWEESAELLRDEIRECAGIQVSGAQPCPLIVEVAR